MHLKEYMHAQCANLTFKSGYILLRTNVDFTARKLALAISMLSLKYIVSPSLPPIPAAQSLCDKKCSVHEQAQELPKLALLQD